MRLSMKNIFPFSISTIKKGVPKFAESRRIILKADVQEETQQEEGAMNIFNKDKKEPETAAQPDAIEQALQDQDDKLRALESKVIHLDGLESRIEQAIDRRLTALNDKEVNDKRYAIVANRLDEVAKAVEAFGNKTGAPIQQGSSDELAERWRQDFFHNDSEKRRAIIQALGVAVDGDGGYLVPDKWSADIYHQLHERSVFRTAGAMILPIRGFKTFSWTREVWATTAEGGAALAEGAASVEISPTFNDVTFSPKKKAEIIKVREELLKDSRIDVYGRTVSPQIVKRMAGHENKWFTEGAGGVTEPTGLLTSLTGPSIAFTATASTFYTTAEALQLIDEVEYMYHSDPSCGFMTHQKTWSTMKREKTTGSGEYYDRLVIDQKGEKSFAGYPVHLNNYMPRVSATKALVFGAFSEYMIIDYEEIEMQRLNERYIADSGEIGFRFMFRRDANLVGVVGIKCLQLA